MQKEAENIMKNISKIGISLVIALCFLLPTSAVMANGEFDAELNPSPLGEKIFEQREIRKVADGQPVVSQDTYTDILGFYLEECIGDDIWEVVGDAVIPFESCYEPKFKLFTADAPSVYEPELEIYKMNADQELCIYETGFEDNAANYMEWGQIDVDCIAEGGTYYDGWTWSDARACGSDHSFKCTMYDEYKNMQDDILFMKKTIDLTADEFELCDGSVVDVDTVGKVIVSFDIYVDGERNADDWVYSNVAPLDYLQFGIYDGTNFDYIDDGPNVFIDSGMYVVIDNDFDGSDSHIWWSTQVGTFDTGMGYDYTSYVTKSDECPGWWHVEWELDQFPDDFGVFFEWRSDKERVFEGAYVDNVEIGIVEDIGEKIYQGHSQEWQYVYELEEPLTHWFEFPLDWDDDIEVSVDLDEDCDDVNDMYYKAICKIKTDDHDTYPTGYSTYLEIDFEIGTVAMSTVEITLVEDDFSHEPIEDGGIVQYPSDVHVKWCYTNDGNVPVTDTEITMNAYKLVQEELFFEDFEGMSAWNAWEGDIGGFAHKSNDFAWSGSSSLAFNHEDTNMIVPGEDYAGYFDDFFDMEGVNNAVMDYYYTAVLPAGATFKAYIVGFQYVLGSVPFLTGEVFQDSWVGPMQPQCQYVAFDFYDDFLYWTNDYIDGIPNAYDHNFFADENGHMTWDAGLGFDLDCSGVAEGDFVPLGYFAADEIPWSGVYIDDVMISAEVKGDLIYSDSMVIPGPCDPGEHCCDQFTWEDVPYCNYLIEVGTEDDCVGANYDDFEIIVLENLEQAGKVEAVDYTECDSTAWCISDVVGNDCGNDGAGDHYALATNCDTNEIPEDVNEYIGLEYIDITHLQLYPEFYTPPEGIEQVTMTGLPLAYVSGWVQQDPLDLVLDLEFYDDPYANQGAPGGAAVATFTVGPGLSSVDTGDVYSGFPCLIWTIDLPAAVPVVEGKLVAYQTAGGCLWGNSEDGDMWSEQLGSGVNPDDFAFALYGGGDLLWEQEVVDTAGGWSFANIDSTLGYGGMDNFIATAYLGAKAEECDDIFTDGFEDYPFDINWDLNTGWLDSYYGGPHGGLYHAYSWAAGDTLTKSVTYGNLSTELTFWLAAESATHPMDFELYVDGFLAYSEYGYTHTDYEMVTVALGGDGLTHQLDFVGMTSDFYGQCLDDVNVEACNWFPDPIPETDVIFVNGTYQMDMRDGYGNVFVEIAPYAETDEGSCDGCEDEFACPAGVLAWEQIGVLGGNAPGICQYFSYNLADPDGDGDPSDSYFVEGDTHFCLRFRLDTVDPGYWDNIPGIGFHLHEMTISDIIYDEIYGVSSFYEDFEDANFINEETGMEWIIDCVTFGTHVSQCDDFKFCIADECPETAPFELSCDEWTLWGTDSWGDGWDSVYDYSPDAFIDVEVNGVLVVDDFTVTGSSASTTFTAVQGDEIRVIYTTANGIFESEHDWGIEDCDGTTWFTYAIGTQIMNVPTELTTMSGSFPAEPIDEAIIWETEIEDAFEAYLTAFWEYDLPAGAVASFEVSANGGDDWYIIAQVEGPADAMNHAIPCTPYDLTPLAGNKLLVRLHLDSEGLGEGWICIDHIAIAGKQDMLPPSASVSLSGNSVGPGLYAGPVTVTITAVDDMAMGEIHYTLDGSETVVAGSSASFKVTADGDHTVTFYPVDATGNVGSTGSVSFSIDNSPPTVALTAPEPGLYLLGNRLMGMSKVFIIGAFTAEATADDAQGVAVVQFMLNGEIVGEDTSAPYDAYIAVKNMGAATLKVVAEDGVGNTAEDSMDITYYKFL